MANATWFRGMWWKLNFALGERRNRKMSNFTRKFLLEDIQNLRYYKLNFRRLRYLDENGILKSAMFKVKWTGGHFHITPYTGGVPLIANKPKGPMKFRELECSAIQYKWLGLQRIPTWEVHFYSSL